MNAISLIPVFVVGLVGSVHCIGMCGGIIGAFSAAPVRRAFPVPVVSATGVVALHTSQDAGLTRIALRTLAYNTGRIASYATAGALAGGMLDGVMTLARVAPLQAAAYLFANLMLVGLGLYLTGLWQGLALLERAGHGIWRRLQPLTAGLLPADSAGKQVLLGALWGWLPCGMVYAMLATAMLSGSAASGAAVMLAFGAGTLPMMMAAGIAGGKLHAGLRSPAARVAGGLIVLGFGLLGLLRATHGMPDWSGLFCIAPSGGTH